MVCGAPPWNFGPGESKLESRSLPLHIAVSVSTHSFSLNSSVPIRKNVIEICCSSIECLCIERILLRLVKEHRLLLVHRLTSKEANPGACSGTCTNTHDPSITRRSDGTYFRFSTSGGIQIHSAPSLTGPWTFKCEMLTGNAKLTVSGNDGSDLWFV